MIAEKYPGQMDFLHNEPVFCTKCFVEMVVMVAASSRDFSEEVYKCPVCNRTKMLRK